MTDPKTGKAEKWWAVRVGDYVEVRISARRPKVVKTTRTLVARRTPKGKKFTLNLVTRAVKGGKEVWSTQRKKFSLATGCYLYKNHIVELTPKQIWHTKSKMKQEGFS